MIDHEDFLRDKYWVQEHYELVKGPHTHDRKRERYAGEFFKSLPDRNRHEKMDCYTLPNRTPSEENTARRYQTVLETVRHYRAE